MKKGLSILLALTLLVSMLVPVPVFGTQGDVGQTTIVTVTGGVVTIGTYGQVLGGVLPTAANLDFTIDPMNLAGLAQNAIVDVTARNNAVTFENNLLRAWNTSSVPVLLTANLQVATTGTPAATAVTNEAAVTNGDTANVLMWMQPNATIQNTATAEFSGANQVVPFGTASQTRVDFRLPARAHNLHVVTPNTNPLEVELRVDPTAPALNGTSFAFGGLINVSTDNAVAAWGNVATVGITATFSMTALTGATDVPAARTASYRTDGDVVIAAGMLASYTSYTAPPLINVPAGGGAVSGTVSNGFYVAGSVSATTTVTGVGRDVFHLIQLSLEDGVTVTNVTLPEFDNLVLTAANFAMANAGQLSGDATAGLWLRFNWANDGLIVRVNLSNSTSIDVTWSNS